MKRFIQMLLLMLFVAAFTVVVPNGPTKHKQETHCAFIQAQPDLMPLVNTAPLFRPDNGFSNGFAYRHGDVEKSSFNSLSIIACSESYLSPGLTIARFWHNSFKGITPDNGLRGLYRLDIGEMFSQVGVTTRHG